MNSTHLTLPKSLIVLTVWVLTISISKKSHGQLNSSNLSIAATESSCGLEATVAWGFGAYLGTESVFWSVKNRKITSVEIDGKTYTATDFPDLFPASTKTTVYVSADLYKGQQYLGQVYSGGGISFEFDGDAIAHMNDYTILEDKFPVLNKDPNWKSGLRLVNMKLTRHNNGNCYDLKQEIKNRIKDQQYQALINEGDALFNDEQWAAAKEKYQEASRLNYQEQYPKDQVSRINELIKQQERDQQYDQLISEGEDLLTQGDLEGAQAKFQKAAGLKPDDLRAEKGIAQVEEAKAKAEDEKKQAEEEEKESENEEKDSSDEEGEEDSEDSDADEEESSSSGSGYKSGSTETESQRRAREEYERQQRVFEYHQKNAEITQQNMRAASELSSTALAIVMWTAGLIYKNVGVDRNYNVYKGDSFFLGLEVGLGASFHPTHFHSIEESYDGYTYYDTHETQNHTNYTIDLQGGGEFWPVYGKRHGFGVFGAFTLGADIFGFQHTKLAGEYGFRAQVGSRAVKLFGEYSRGTRSLNYDPWISATQSGEGKANWDFQRFRLGPRLTFNGNFMGTTVLNFDVHGIFELPSTTELRYGNEPLIFRWNPGMHIGFWGHNRLRIYAEFFWRYPRIGETTVGYSDDATSNGVSFKLGVIRRFDIFGNSAYQFPQRETKHFLQKRNKWALSLGNPTVDWAAVRDSNYFNNQLNLSSNWFLVEKDINFIPNLSGVIGVGMSGPRGAQLKVMGDTTQTWNGNTLAAGTEVKFTYLSAHIPVGLRLMSGALGNAVYWARGSFVPKLNFYSWQDENVGGEIELFVPSWEVGIGVDLAVSPKMGLRLAAFHQRDMKPISKDYPILNRSAYVQLGLIF